MNFDWSDLAFGSKKPVNSLKATFIVAPREISEQRFKELIKTYLPKGNIVLGLAKEDHVLGFEGQPQFRMLKTETVDALVQKVNNSGQSHKIYTLRYFQRELKYLFEKLEFNHVVLVNGSWKYAFHTQAPYYSLVNTNTTYELVSPFTDKAEAKSFEANVMPEIEQSAPVGIGVHSAQEMLELAQTAAKYSFDYSFQTGATLGQKKGAKYQLLTWSFNRVVPFQTYAMLNGASRETNFSPPNDLNHYDTIHAEAAMIVKCGAEGIDLKGKALFINLLPCPTCARMLAETSLAEVIYQEDHSDGYAVKILELSGKQVNRVV